MFQFFPVSATGGWPERENVNVNRLQELVDMYKAIVVAQRQQQDKDKKKQRGKYLSYTVSVTSSFFHLILTKILGTNRGNCSSSP